MGRREIELMEDWCFWFGEEKNGMGQQIDLPHDWVIGSPYCKENEEASQGYHVKRGTGWYQKKLEMEVKKDHRYFLDFGGIYEKSKVSWNGHLVGGHVYGYTPFRLEVTEFVRSGENLLEIQVDSKVTPPDRWYTGAGIYRTVRLLETGSKYLDEHEMVVDIVFSEENYGEAMVSVKTKCDLPLEGFLVFGGDTYVSSGQGILTFKVKNPKLWSAETPNLYTLQVCLMDGEVISDMVTCRLGIREVKIMAGKGMAVNGCPVKLRGVCLHQDVGCQGVAAKKEIWRERLKRLKDMGCNAIRAAHHIHSQEFMDLCDEMGFYVYEECFDKWTAGHYGRFFKNEWQKDLDTMVKRDRNRPSVIIWGVGNEVENQGQPYMLAILERMIKRVKELDDTRPVTYAMNPHFKRENNTDLSKISDIQQFVDEADETEIWDVDEKIKRIQKIGALVDLISCNYQEQWYEKIHQAIPDKLILGTEIYQYFKGHEQQFKNFTQDNPSLVPMQYDYVIGGMIWAGIDYLGESMGYPAKGWGGALMRTNGEPKAGYYIMKSYWTKEPMVYFAVMDYSLGDEGVKDHWDIPPYVNHWHFPQWNNIVIPYLITTNCEEVEVHVNDSRIYVPKPEECSNHLITGFLPWIPGCVTVVGKNGNKEVCRHVTVTPGWATKLEFEQKIVHLPQQRNYQAMFLVQAVDEKGNPCFRESGRVRFYVEGPAKILGVDNGDILSHEGYQETSMHMFRGKVGVLVGLTGERGRVVIYADADGLKRASMIIQVDG